MVLRIQKISCHKVIVHLTNNDLDKLDIDLEKKPKENIHKFLFEVMERVQIQTGFDPYHGGQVIVEASSNEHGMELVISKIPDKTRKLSREEFSRVKSIKVRQTRKIKRDENKTVIIFNTYLDFENAVSRIPDEFFNNTQLYRRNGKYALVTSNKIAESVKQILCEYSLRIGRYTPKHCQILESWEIIASDSGLSDMCRNIKDIL